MRIEFIIINFGVCFLVAYLLAPIVGRKLGWSVIIKNVISSAILFAFIAYVQFCLSYVYPSLPDIWKIPGMCGCLLISVPVVFLDMQIKESKMKNRIEVLRRLGWRPCDEEDYESFDEWLKSDRDYTLIHPKHGIKFVTKAEEIEFGFWTW